MAELERLLAAPARGDLWERHFHGKAERDQLLPALFAYAGLRRSELLGLAWDDVDARAARRREAVALGRRASAASSKLER